MPKPQRQEPPLQPHDALRSRYSDVVLCARIGKSRVYFYTLIEHQRDVGARGSPRRGGADLAWKAEPRGFAAQVWRTVAVGGPARLRHPTAQRTRRQLGRRARDAPIPMDPCTLAVVSVELYFVKPEPTTGRVIFPFWDEQGEPRFPVEHRVIASLKWAAAEECLFDAGVGMRETPIPPEQLVEGGRRGMKILLTEIAEMHPDFKSLADQVGDDGQAIDGLLHAFEAEHDWVGGDDASRARAYAHARGASAMLHWLLLEMWRAGQQGFHGCWSY